MVLSCPLACLCDCWLCVVAVSLLAGSEPVAHPLSHFDRDTDEETQTLAQTDIQQPWLEYSVWQECEWARIYIPGPLDNLNYGTRMMMYLTCQRTLFGSAETQERDARSP